MELMQEDVPKLLPLWSDVVLDHIFNVKDYHHYAKDRQPDYGGMGVDVTVKGNDIQHVIPKHQNIHGTQFAAEVCSLPFAPMTKTSLDVDPCLSGVIEAKSRADRFCQQLRTVRRTLKYERNKKHTNLILTAQKKTKKLLDNPEKKKVTIPKSVLQLAELLPEKVPVPEINFRFAGGCLAVCKAAGRHILVHPIEKSLNKLILTPIEQTCEPLKAFQLNTSERVTVKLKHANIHQVESRFEGYCYVRHNESCHFINFAALPEVSKTQCLESCSNIAYISPSPYIPTEVLSINQSNKLSLNDTETEDCIWQLSELSFNEELHMKKLLSCTIGSHPRSALCLTEENVYCYDLRMKDKENCCLFSHHHPSISHNHPELSVTETLTAMKTLTSTPFQHFISSTYHLALCDERYPGKPVLMWNHLLKGTPLYFESALLDTHFHDSETLVLLGTQDTQEVALFDVTSRHSLVQTLSQSPPLHLSSVTDCVNSLKLHCVNVDNNIEKRVSYPLLGVALVPQSNRKGFTALQLTSRGDVFYQDFKVVPKGNMECTYKVGPGCVLSPPEKVLPSLRKFVKNTGETDAVFVKSEYIPYIAAVDLTNNSSTNCSMCGYSAELRRNDSSNDVCSDSSSDDSSNDGLKQHLNVQARQLRYFPPSSNDVTNGDSSNDVCRMCGLSNIHGQKLASAYDREDVVIGPKSEVAVPEGFVTFPLGLFNDPLSKKILQAWEDPDTLYNMEQGESQWYDYDSDSTLNTVSQSVNLDDSNQSMDVDSVNFMSQSTPKVEEDIPMDSPMSTYAMVPSSQDFKRKISETLKTPSKPAFHFGHIK